MRKHYNNNKYNFNRKRLLDRIREGSIPQQRTTRKYDISNAEVNAIRKERNHPPLVVAFAPSAYAPILAVNEETKRIQEQYLEQQQLTENVKEDEQKLGQSFKKLMVEKRGKMLKVPPEQQFALKTFHDYVWYRGSDGQPMSWVINITGKKAKEKTIQNRVGKEDNWQSGQLYLFFKKHLPAECLKDVRRCLRKERIGPILRKVRDDEAANPSTTLSTNQALYVLYQNFPGLLPEFQADLNWLNNFNAVTKKKADAYIADKRKYTIEYGFTDIKKIFKDTFGRESKEFLYISVYEECPSRDDLGKLVINPPNMTENVEKTMNYIVKKNGLWTIYLNVYKTMDFFGRVVVRFSNATSKLISNYITKHRIKNGEYLFGSFGKDGKMSATVAAWLVEAGIKDGKVQGQTKTPGAINLLRHAYVSQKIKEEDVLTLSETMKHSPLATELYVRKIQPVLVENMIKIDERKLVYEEPEMIQTRSRVLEKRKREEEAKKKAKKGRGAEHRP
ncbi:unknown protein [Bathycoccus prasinos]|uniref:Uncharacterized protein n=1 Tax=Bathycoccus prasinos TaxID=41875 RepID=K8EQ66_9CHLO|nr:unknown protein [Bathycoccus prasinos]CCO20079.1 unknown protein [Bathycoccus prasinos]|eukprot:XP_007508993.1 unknown protein [Bathycoccus prasinos]